MRDISWMRFSGGVFDQSGNLITSSLLNRAGRPVVESGFNDEATSSYADEEVIFGGYLFPHFGHFTLESLARIWFARKRPELPIVFTPRQNNHQLRKWQKELFGLLGLADRVRLINESTRFRKIHVPDPALEIRGFASHEYVSSVTILTGASRPADRIWLSRRGVDEPAGHGNGSAEFIETELAGKGWKIIRPEELDVSEQLAHLASASRVAGDEGAAFHALVYIRFQQPPRIDMFSRQKGVHENYRMLAPCIRADHRFHSIRGRKVYWRERNRIRFDVTDPMDYIRRLD